MNVSGLWWRLTVCLPGLLCAALAGAQAVPPEPPPTNDPGYFVRAWTVKQGLPENTVSALLQTSDGYLWAGTPDGLACFDGVQFHRYGVPNGLPHTGITALLEDRHGILWVGTEHGLAYCDGSRHPAPVFTAELPGININSLAEDAAGRVWIGSDRGLYLRTSQGITRVDGTNDGTNGLPRTGYSALYADHAGAIWAWTASLKLLKISPAGIETVPVDFPLPRIKSVRSLFEDHAGRLWLSPGNGFLLYRENGAWKTYRETDGVPYFYVSSLAETRDGTIWGGSYGGGVIRLQGDRFNPAPVAPGTFDMDIRALCADREGNLWVGTSSCGLICLRHKQLTTLAADAGLGNEVVHSVGEMPDGSLVAATEDGIYYQQDGKFKRQYLSKADIYVGTRSVLPTSDSNLWWAADALLLDRNTFVPLGFNPPAMPIDRRFKTVYCLYEDRQHQLWAGSVGNQFPGKGGSLWRIKDGNFLRHDDMPSTNPVLALAEAPDGTMVAGTENAGLYWLSPGHPLHLTWHEGLGSDSIRALHFDSAGTLWIGTRSGGLSRLQDGRLTTYTTRDGLASDTISQIVEDDDGALWLGGNRGISRLAIQALNDFAAGKIASLHPLNLDEADGMLVEECTGGSNPGAIKSRSGLLYFSTLKGIVAVDPRRYRSHGVPPVPVIEEILVNDRILPVSPPPLGAVNPAAEPEEFTLPPGWNNLEFHYTGLHSAIPEAIDFRYQLEGLDRGWVDAGNRRFANYAQIPPGHYRFQILAANRDGTWPAAGASVRLFLQPHFYQTWWFQTGVLGTGALLLALLVRALVKRRLHQRLERLEWERSLENERGRIARDLHDELGTRLTGIAHLGELAVRNTGLPADAKSQVGLITSRIQQLMGAMDEVVWTINPKNDSLPNIVNFLSDYTERFLTLTGIRWRLEADPEFPDLAVSAQTRHNLLLAAKETLNNAVRHGAPTLIQLRIHLKNGRLEVVISDDGCGFDLSQSRPRGNGLANIRSRLELIKGSAAITSTPGQGTCVTLSVPLAGMAGQK